MLARRRPVMSLLPLGLAGGHALGAWLGDRAGAAPLGGWQGFFGWFAFIGVPLGLAGVARLATSEMNTRAVPVRGSALIAAQVLLFVGIEFVEHLVLGMSPWRLVALPAFWLGVMAQVVVAAAVWLAIRVAVASVHALVARSRRIVRASDEVLPTLVTAALPVWLQSSGCRRRGPPVGLGTGL